METVKVSKKYQVVIPEEIREKAGIKPGAGVSAAKIVAFSLME
jgi:bifunctional DNA-binding transcriptional regulator/antitoxin component of YhaV-PrlF toxin-antitoxin module